MNMNDLDLNLLVIFRAVMRQRNISRAAADLGQSQPTVSNALARLRRQLDDPLFVRAPRGVAPTPYAVGIAPKIDAALDLLADSLTRSAFDPATARRDFSIIMTDIAEAVILPQALQSIGAEAPGVHFRTLQLPSVAAAAALRRGDIDLAIGYLPEFEAGFYQQTVFETDYVVIGAADNPLLARRLTTARFAQARHALAEAAGTGHHVVERLLKRQGLDSQIAARVPRFLSLPLIVAASDLLATVPRPLGTLLAGTAALRVVDHPLDLPPVDIRMLWHERVHQDPASQWLRRRLAGVFARTVWK